MRKKKVFVLSLISILSFLSFFSFISSIKITKGVNPKFRIDMKSKYICTDDQNLDNCYITGKIYSNIAIPSSSCIIHSLDSGKDVNIGTYITASKKNAEYVYSFKVPVSQIIFSKTIPNSLEPKIVYNQVFLCNFYNSNECIQKKFQIYIGSLEDINKIEQEHKHSKIYLIFYLHPYQVLCDIHNKTDLSDYIYPGYTYIGDNHLYTACCPVVAYLPSQYETIIVKRYSIPLIPLRMIYYINEKALEDLGFVKKITNDINKNEISIALQNNHKINIYKTKFSYKIEISYDNGDGKPTSRQLSKKHVFIDRQNNIFIDVALINDICNDKIVIKAVLMDYVDAVDTVAAGFLMCLAIAFIGPLIIKDE